MRCDAMRLKQKWHVPEDQIECAHDAGKDVTHQDGDCIFNLVVLRICYRVADGVRVDVNRCYFASFVRRHHGGDPSTTPNFQKRRYIGKIELLRKYLG